MATDYCGGVRIIISNVLHGPSFRFPYTDSHCFDELGMKQILECNVHMLPLLFYSLSNFIVI